MLPEPNLDLGQKTRRAVLKAAGAALGVAAAGTAAGHPGEFGGGNKKFYGGTDGYLGDNVADAAENSELVGYHSLGGVGPASSFGRPEDAHTGGMSEMRIHDDLAFVNLFSGRGEDSQRGMAIVDISEFTRAESEAELENAGITVLSFVRNDNSQSACMDVKVSDDGEYVFIAKQAVTALFGEGIGTQPNTDNHSNSAGAGSLVAVDVSDPGNPEVTDEENLSHWSVGPHNCWYHQIGGEEYVFTVHGTSGAASKTNVFQFDRATGQLQQVNAWSWDTNLAQGEYGTESNLWYHHDINVQEDPRTGRPLAYLHCWDAGLRILDVSDPLNVQEVGVFEQYGAHHAVPAPTLVDGKRVAVTGHENPDSEYHAHIETDETGRYNLVDLDPLDTALDPDSGVERVYVGCASSVQNADAHEPLERAPYQMYAEDDAAHVVTDGSGDPATELDHWVMIGENEGWDAAPGFEYEAENADDEDEESPPEYDGFGDFRISTHNLDMDTEGRVYAGHYHAGMRAFQVVTPDSDLPDATLGDATGTGDGWGLVPTSYFRRGKDIPDERALANDTPEASPVGAIDGLTASTPFFWNAVERNGVIFASDINAGPHAMHQDGAEVGEDTPIDVSVERSYDASVMTAGQTQRITITADGDEPVAVRDAVPSEWDVYTEHSTDITRVHEIDGYQTIVELELDENGQATYFVEAPDSTGAYTFGPIEYARADANDEPIVDGDFGGGNSATNRLWRKENGAVVSTDVVGVDTSL